MQVDPCSSRLLAEFGNGQGAGACVSMAALVTFLADRLPVLNEPVLGVQYRTFVATQLLTIFLIFVTFLV
jgi:hypothetical protein